jgi:hypothetical protein
LTTFLAGKRLTAAALNAAIGLSAAKGGDTNRSSANTGTTLTADPDLTVAVLANTSYLVRFSLLYKGAATNTGDLKLSFSVPSGATLAGGFLGIANPLGVTILPVTSAASVLVSYSNGTGNPLWCQVTANLVTSAAAGNLVLTWAQNTSSATSTTLMAGSSLQAVAH